METIHKGVQEGKTLPVSRSPALCSPSLTHHILFFFSKLKKHARINSVGAEASQRATNHSVISYFASVQGSSPSSHLSSCTWGTFSVSQLSPRMLHDPATAGRHSGALHFLLTPVLTPWRNETHLLQMSRHILLPVASCPSRSEAWAGCLQHFSFSITLPVISDVFAVAVCTRHFRAIETLWISKQSTLTHDYVRALQCTPWRAGSCSSQQLLLFRMGKR